MECKDFEVRCVWFVWLDLHAFSQFLMGLFFSTTTTTWLFFPINKTVFFVPLFLPVVLIKSPYLIGLIIFLHQKMCAVICVDIFRSHSV